MKEPFVRTAVLVALVAAAVSAAPPARAESAFGANLGYSKTVDGQGQFTGGVQFRMKFLPLFGFEILASYRKENVEAKGVTVLEVQQIPLQVSVLIYPLTLGPLRLYGLGGFGTYFTSSKGVNNFVSFGEESSTNFGAQLGGGTDVKFGGPFFLSGDVRYVWQDVDTLRDVEQAFREKQSADYWVTTVMINIKF